MKAMAMEAIASADPDDSRLCFILFGLYSHFTNVFNHAEIKKPFLIITGAGSSEGMATADHALRLIPHATQAIIGRSGQLPQLERVDQVFDEITNFLRNNSYGDICKDAEPEFS